MLDILKKVFLKNKGKIVILLFAIIIFVFFYAASKLSANSVLPSLIKSNSEELINRKWTGDNKTILHLKNDEEYQYFIDPDDYEKNYYKGYYELYNGNEAKKYIDRGHDELGIEKQKEILKSKSTKDYYVIVLNNKELMINGNFSKENIKMPYMCIHDKKDNTLDCYIMNTQKTIKFKDSGKLEGN